MRRRKRPEDTPAVETTDVAAEVVEAAPERPAAEITQDGAAANGAEAAPKKAPPRRRPRRRKDTPAEEAAELASAEADTVAAPESTADLLTDHLTAPEAPAKMVAAETLSAERILLELAEREVAETGEPVPLRRGELPPAVALDGGITEEVIVPEAALETPEPALDEFILPAVAALAAGLPPITAELLADVRGVSLEQVERDRLAPAPARMPDREAAFPGDVLVPEATLEAVPEDWAEEEEPAPLGILREVFPETEPRGRRRRGRDRRRGGVEEKAPRTETPVAARPEAPSRPAPIVLGGQEAKEFDRERTRQEEKREYKEILVNVDDRETRIAVMESGRLVELHVEREERVVGGIYKGRVCNVLPGMDCAFVDIGLERNAFLYVGDILFEDTSRNGSSDAPTKRTSRDVKISDLAKPGQEILVQVVKGPRGTKGARVSTKISLPGRYLVLMPDGDHMGVSRKIDDGKERERLRRIGEQLQPKGFGLIIRTEAEGRTEQELKQDLDYLVKSWQQISERVKRERAPSVLHKDLGVILKTIRDLFGSDTDKLVLDSREEYEKVMDTLGELAPDLVDRVHLHDEPEPLFSRYNLEEEIERLLRRKVWLRNGAYLLLDTTEALTTIDVNTGKFVGTSSLAETILKTNLDAVDEIARQLRLRDIGGMIVLDFIDMSSSRDRQLVMRALENAFRKDRTRIKIAHISPLGLVEMTRKRTSEAVTDVMSNTCPYCQGRGRVWSAETIAINIEREIKRMAAKQDLDAVLIHANPEVAAWLIGPEGESVEQLERAIRRPVYVRARHDFHVEKYEIVPADMMEIERQMMEYHGGQVVDATVTKIELITPPRSAAWADGYFVDVANGVKFQGQNIRVRLTDVRRSFALAEPVPPSTSVDRSEPI